MDIVFVRVRTGAKQGGTWDLVECERLSYRDILTPKVNEFNAERTRYNLSCYILHENNLTIFRNIRSFGQAEATGFLD